MQNATKCLHKGKILRTNGVLNQKEKKREKLKMKVNQPISKTCEGRLRDVFIPPAKTRSFEVNE